MAEAASSGFSTPLYGVERRAPFFKQSEIDQVVTTDHLDVMVTRLIGVALTLNPKLEPNSFPDQIGKEAKDLIGQKLHTHPGITNDQISYQFLQTLGLDDDDDTMDALPFEPKERQYSVGHYQCYANSIERKEARTDSRESYLETQRIFNRVSDITAKVKPVNLAKFIVDVVYATHPASVVASVAALLEAYGVLWMGTNQISHAVATEIQQGVKWMTEGIDEVRSFVNAHSDRQLPEAELTNHDNSDYEAVFSMLGSGDSEIGRAIGPFAKVVVPVALLALNGLGCYKPAEIVTTAIKKMADNLKNTKTILTSADSIKKAVDFGFKAAFDRRSLHMVEELSEQVKDLTQRMQNYKLKLDTDRGTIAQDAQERAQIFEDCDAVYNLIKAAQACSKDDRIAGLNPYLVTLLRLHSEVMLAVNRLTKSIGVKQEPVCLWLYGRPGVGKTRLSAYIVKLLGEIEGKQLTTYVRSCTEQFHSGYTGQDVYMYDDFASATEGLDIKEFVPIKSGNAYGMNMADVTEKGLKFSSRYVIVCSNLAGINNTDAICNPECIDRRRDLFVRVHDPIALRAQETGEPPELHYRQDFSHLSLIEYAPIRNVDQNQYAARGNITVTDIIRRMTELEMRYRTTFLGIIHDQDGERVVDETGYQPIVQITAQELDNVLGPPTATDVYRNARNNPANQVIRRGRSPPVQRRRYMRPPDVDFQFMENHGDDVAFAANQYGCLFMGRAGTGKTTLAQLILAKLGKGKVQIYDEFQVNDEKCQHALQHLDSYHSGKSKIMPILICNELDVRRLQSMSIDALKRRCKVFEFDLTYGARFARQTGKPVNLPGDQTIKYTFYPMCDKKISKYVLAEEVLDTLAYVQSDNAFSVSLTLPRWSAMLPKDRYYVNKCIDELKDTSLFSLIGNTKVTYGDQVSLSLTQRLRLASIGSKIGNIVGTDVRSSIRAINARCLQHIDRVTLAFVLKDACFVLCTETGEIVISEYDAHPKMIETMFERDVGTIQHNRASDTRVREAFFEAVEGIYFLLKLTGSMAAVVVHGIHRRNEAQYVKKTSVIKNEALSWADQVEQEYGTEEEHALRLAPDAPPYLPKNHPSRQRKGVTAESDPSVRGHGAQSYAMYSETYDPITPRKPVRVSKPSVSTTLANEASRQIQNEAILPVARQQMGRKQLASRKFIDSGATYIPELTELDTEMLPTLSRVPNMLPDGVIKDHCDEFHNEAVTDAVAYGLFHFLISNTVFIGIPDKVKQRGVMIHQNIGVTNAHTISHQSVGETFDVFETSLGEGRKIEYHKMVATILEIDKFRDYCVFKIPTARHYKSILHFLPSKSDNAMYDHNDGVLLYVFPDKVQQIVNLQLQTITQRTVSSSQRYGLTYAGHATGLAYGPINSVPGLCGSMVVVMDPKRTGKFIALHSGANTTCGIGSLIYREMFERYTKLESHSNESEEQSTRSIKVLKHQCVLPIKPMMIGGLPIVAVPFKDGKILHQYQPTKTQLYRSPLALDEESPFEPAILDRRDNRMPYDEDLYAKGIHNYDKQQGQMDLNELDIVIEELAEYYASVVHNAGIRIGVLTKTEAINGISYIAQSNALARDTSAGFPWKHFARDAKKSNYLVYDSEAQHWKVAETPLGRSLNHAVDSIIAAASQGQRTAVINIATLKDEPRKLKRIYVEPATRVFWAAPLCKVIADRKYFHAAVAAIAATHEHHPIKIGINPQAYGFHKLFHWLARVSMIGFDLDTKNWDGSVPVCVMERLFRIWNRIYEVNDPKCTAEDQEIRRVLHSHLVRPLILYHDCIVQLPGGNVSGQSMTAADNSMINHIYHYYVWRQLMRQHGLLKFLSLESFHERVASAFYGDDVIDVVDVDMLRVFTPQAYIRECAKFGVICTPASKSGEASFKHLQKLEFLKRNFLRATLPSGEKSPYFCGALQFDSFRKMLDWTVCSRAHHFFLERDVVKYDPITIGQVVDVALLEITNYGREAYGILIKHLREKCRQYGISVPQWRSFTGSYNQLWGLDLPEGVQDDNRLLSHGDMADSKSQPATATDGGAATVPVSETVAQPLHPSETPAASNSSVVPTFSGDYGSLPREWYEKEICIGSVTWNSSMLQGTVLYTRDVNPEGINAYVGYFARPYNLWAGGAIYMVMVVGTGFHGGKLGICRIPPNYDGSLIQTVTDATVLHWTHLDAKEARTNGYEIVDQRNILFHWRNTDSSSVDGKAGTFCLFVLAPLVNAQGTATSINVVIFAKPAPDFRLSQPLPLATMEELPDQLESLDRLFPRKSIINIEPITDRNVTDLVINSSTTLAVVGSQYQYGMVDFSGKARYKAHKPFPRQIWAADGTVYGPGYALFDAVQWPDQTSVIQTVLYDTSGPQALTDASQLDPHDVSRPIKYNGGFSYGGKTWCVTVNGPSSNNQWIFGGPSNNLALNFSQNSNAQMDLSDGNFMSTQQTTANRVTSVLLTGIEGASPVQAERVYKPKYDWSPPLPESVITFQTAIWTNDTNNSATPDTVTRRGPFYFASCQMLSTVNEITGGHATNSLKPGEALLMVMSDITTNLPLSYVKMYYEGFLTAPPSASNVVYSYSNLKFTPFAIVAGTAVIPTSSEHAGNSLLVQSRDRKVYTADDIADRVFERIIQSGRLKELEYDRYVPDDVRSSVNELMSADFRKSPHSPGDDYEHVSTTALPRQSRPPTSLSGRLPPISQ